MPDTVGLRCDFINTINAVIERMTIAIYEHRSWLMTFVNPASVVAARRDPTFAGLLQEFDLVAPDGIGMVIALKALHGGQPIRISFDSTSLAPLVFQLAANLGLSVVLAGGSPTVAELARQKVETAYPGIQIVGTFDGYRDHVSLIESVLAINPRIVIAGMGAIVQERFLLELRQKGWTGVGFTCGGYLDQLAVKGNNYYPVWVDRYNVRWMYRLAKEPKRLWRRYLLEYPEFGVKLCRRLLFRGGRA